MKLTFGTSGLRGIMGPGENQMNEDVIRLTTRGLANYLNRNYANPQVVVGYDSRLKSKDFAMLTAQVLSEQGIKVFIFDQIVPVPVLSYTIRKKGLQAGVMITASHNPKEYNGYKVYGETGGQILPDVANCILREIELVEAEANRQERESQGNGSICWLNEEEICSYLEELDGATTFTEERELAIVYTPLNGAGRNPVLKMLERNGFHDVSLVREQEKPDGSFPTCPIPNPEREEVYQQAIVYGTAKQADILIATDPDCDRVGAMVWHGGEYRQLQGNEIGVLIGYYLCSGGGPKGKTIVTSVVSTPLIDCIAEAHGLQVERTLVGFKYIAKQMDALGEQFLFGFEESNGYLIGQYTRDKDGVLGVKLLCQMAAHYKAQGKTLIDVMDEIHRVYGKWEAHTLQFENEDVEKISEMMDCVGTRQRAEAIFGSLSRYVNYEKDFTGLERAKMVEIQQCNGTKILLRPSGTEPKLKVYIFSKSTC